MFVMVLNATSLAFNEIENLGRGSGGSVVQCLAHNLRIVSSILAHGSFLVRGSALINPSRTIWSTDA